jgi:drug/metabolite transporter (DMT)-like permease
MPPPDSLLWGAAGGISGVVGIVAFWSALASGQMRIAAPVTAVFTAIVPVVVAAFTEKLPTGIQFSGFAVALVAVWVLSRPEHAEAGRPEGLGLAILAGFGFGGFLVFIHRAGDTYVYWPIAAARVASIGVLLLMILRQRREWRPARNLMHLVFLAGVLDVGGNVTYVLASQGGQLAIAAVMSSLYPAMTVLLARLFLKERMTHIQALGILAALVAIILITAGRYVVLAQQ